MMITQDGLGRFVVSDARRIYGRYRTLAMAERRVAQICWARRPPKEK